MSAPLGSCLSANDQAALRRLGHVLREERRQAPLRRAAQRYEWHGLDAWEIARELEITPRQVRELLEGSS